MLSAAIGGVKLQVAPIHFERAELLLTQIQEERDESEEDEAPLTAIASREIAEDLQAEREDAAEVNQLADKVFRSAVFGLIFPPLQFYTIYLLASIATAEGTISSHRRWKVWVSLLLIVPIGAILLLFLLFGF